MRDTWARTVVESPTLRTAHATIQGLDTILLFLADFGLGFDDVPEPDDVILDLLNVDRTEDMVGAPHLLNIRLELAPILPVDFRMGYFALLIEFGVRLRMYFRKSLLTVLVQRRLPKDTKTEALGQASLQLRTSRAWRDRTGRP